MIKTSHELLSKVYRKSQELEVLFKRINMKYKLESSFKNYIKIDGQYEVQNYPIPVFVMEDFFDVGINLDGYFFECFIAKEKILTKNIFSLKKYFKKLEVYGDNHSMVDYYYDTDTEADFLNRLNSSDEVSFGLAVYFDFEGVSSKELKELIHIFKSI